MTRDGAALVEVAPAKVNLTLRVLGRRPDGFHELDSLVAFAEVGDTLVLRQGEALSLEIDGPFAAACGAADDNLVLRAVRALAALEPRARLGSFHLTKALPVAAGLGGGSADAAAALRLIARANRLPADHAALRAAAEATGSDVPVCLDPRARRMGGRGEEVGPPLGLAPMPAVLVNPGVACQTAAVFAEFARGKEGGLRGSAPHPSRRRFAAPQDKGLVAEIVLGTNDLEAPASRLVPAITDVLTALRATTACGIARLSGSGATCFALYPDREAAEAAARALASARPGWWVVATSLS